MHACMNVFSYIFVTYPQGEGAFRNVYMKREGIPFFVWYMGFKPGLTAFKNKFRNHIDALDNDHKTNKNRKKKKNKNEQ